MKTNQQIIEDCDELFYLFNHDALLTDVLANITNEPYFHSVNGFLSDQKQKKIQDSCYKCWDRIVSVSFASGFIMASMLDPDSKVSLKGIRELRTAIKKSGILPIYEDQKKASPKKAA